jgi:hypothetical protein
MLERQSAVAALQNPACHLPPQCRRCRERQTSAEYPELPNATEFGQCLTQDSGRLSNRLREALHPVEEIRLLIS